MNYKTSAWLFFVASLANLIGHAIENVDLANYSKVLLMPFLIYYVVESTKGSVNKQILFLAVALIFSWIGDLFLIKEDFFLFGVGAFLLAQITYIFIFYRAVNHSFSFSFLKALPYLLYATLFLFLVLPTAGNMQIPISIYGIILVGMGYFSLCRIGNTNRSSFMFAVAGSTLFILSDSLIALNMFYTEIPSRGLWVMSTYILAQFFLVNGIIRHYSESA
jgi:uncharacterized membrane protein YhhN